MGSELSRALIWSSGPRYADCASTSPQVSSWEEQELCSLPSQMEEDDDDGEEKAASGSSSCFFFTHCSSGRKTPTTTPLLDAVWLTSWTLCKASGVAVVEVVQSSAVVGAADSSPLGGGFIIKLNPPCTLQNCRGTLLLLSLIDVTGSLWPQPPIPAWPICIIPHLSTSSAFSCAAAAWWSGSESVECVAAMTCSLPVVVAATAAVAVVPAEAADGHCCM